MRKLWLNKSEWPVLNEQFKKSDNLEFKKNLISWKQKFNLFKVSQSDQGQIQIQIVDASESE